MAILEQKCSEIEAQSISAQTARRDSGFLFKTRLIFFGKIAVAILALGLLVNAIQVPALLETLLAARWPLLLLALMLLVPNIWVQVLKWHYLLKLANPNVSGRTAFKSLIVGYPLGFVTPGRLGEIGRAFYIKEISQTRTFRLFIADKASLFVFTLLGGILGLIILMGNDLTSTMRLMLNAAMLLLAAVAIYAVTSAHIPNLIGRLLQLSNFSRRHLIRLLGFSFLFYLIFTVQFSIIALSFADQELISVLPAATSMFLTKTFLPISFSDLGIREGASVFFLAKLNVDAAAAFNAGFLLFLINLVIPTLAGLPVLLKTRAEMISLSSRKSTMEAA